MSVIYRYSRPAERKLARAALMDLQDGRCAGCIADDRPLQVDHDHATDWIRGLLCSSCNIGEGHGGDAFAWSLYVASPPMSFIGRPDDLRAHWLECAAVAERAALADIHNEWQSGFIRMSRELMEEKWREYQGWSRARFEVESHPEFERWHAEDEHLDQRAMEAVRLAITVDPGPLRAFDFRERDVEHFMRTLAFQFRRGPDRELLTAREEEIELELACLTDPHPFQWDGEHVPHPDGYSPLRYCGYEGCGFHQDQHPRFQAKQARARLGIVRNRIADLLGEDVAA